MHGRNCELHRLIVIVIVNVVSKESPLSPLIFLVHIPLSKPEEFPFFRSAPGIGNYFAATVNAEVAARLLPSTFDLPFPSTIISLCRSLTSCMTFAKKNSRRRRCHLFTDLNRVQFYSLQSLSLLTSSSFYSSLAFFESSQKTLIGI